jgi:hypothetical protein
MCRTCAAPARNGPGRAGLAREVAEREKEVPIGR